MASPNGSGCGEGVLEPVVGGTVVDGALEVSPVQPAANKRQSSAVPLSVVSIRRLMLL
jgi:hypothetical protein